MQQLTLMRAETWRDLLNKPAVCTRRRSDGRSFAERFPVDAAEIISGIEFGVDVGFVGDRASVRGGRNRKVEDECAAKVDKVIAADVAALKKAGPFDSPPMINFVASPIGAVPKKDSDKVRVIHNLSAPWRGASVNASIRERPVKLSSVGVACRHIRAHGPACFMVKLDIEAAYKQIPVRPQDWHLLGFKWRGKYYHERVLPFGLTSSCALWELYATALQDMLERIAGIGCVIHYVDDFLIVTQSKEEAQRALSAALALCEQLGLPVSPEKTEGPAQRLTFLGVELDTVAMTVALPQKKLLELRELMCEWVERRRGSVRELQRVRGKLQFASQVVQPGKFFTRRIIELEKRLRDIAASEDSQCSLPAQLLADFAWWKEGLAQWNGISIMYQREWEDADKIELFTDACNTGYGATWEHRWFGGSWGPAALAAAQRSQRLSMPFLEALALVTAAFTWGPEWSGRKILFRCDAKAVVDAIDRGSSRTAGVMHLMRQLALAAIRCNFAFRCLHVPGKDNTLADAFSRGCSVQQVRELVPGRPLQQKPTPAVWPSLQEADSAMQPSL